MALDPKEKDDLNVGSIMKLSMSDPEVRFHKKEALKYAQNMMKGAYSLISDPLKLEELETLVAEKEYLEKMLNCVVEVYLADEPGDDSLGKSKNAEPGRPAIFIE